MATQGQDGGMNILDELVFDAEPPAPAGGVPRNSIAIDCGMTFLSETAFDASAPADPVQDRVEELARLILTSENPVQVAERVQQLLRDRLAHPPHGSTERP